MGVYKKSPNRMINARAETLAEKSIFKRLLKNRRCLVLADAFYEWRKEGKGKVPMLFDAQGYPRQERFGQFPPAPFAVFAVEKPANHGR